jgi:hypothetical protein
MAYAHSLSVNFTSLANECKCWTRLVITVRSLSLLQPAIAASTAWVMVSSLILRIVFP